MANQLRQMCLALVPALKQKRPQSWNQNERTNKDAPKYEQAISACERALCQLTVTLTFREEGKEEKERKKCVLQMVFRSKAPS